MKKRVDCFLKGIVLVVVAFSLVACGGGGSSDSAPELASGSDVLKIEGSFGEGEHTYTRLLKKVYSVFAPSVYALDPTQVYKVVVFYGEGSYTEAEVVNDSFSIDVRKGTPSGLIFLGSSDNYLGHLQLAEGIESLPFSSVSSEISKIDLQTLSSYNSVVTSSYDPLVNDLNLTTAETAAISQSDDLFSSIIKNPDVDGNGSIDFLEDKFFKLKIMYFINGGSYEGALAPSTMNTPADISSYRLILETVDATSPPSVFFTGPDGSGLSNAESESNFSQSSGMIYFSPNVNSPDKPVGGTYVVDYSTDSLDFVLPDQLSASDNIVLAVPEVTLNDDGTINKFSWDYKLSDGSSSLTNPESVLTEIELQIDGVGDPCAEYDQSGRIYNSGMLSASATEHTLSCQNLNWNDASMVYMAYNDVYGNHYVVGWSNL